MRKNFALVSLVLALAAFGAACGDEGSMERATERVDAAAGEVGENVEEGARDLAEDAKAGAAASAAEDVEQAAREGIDTLDASGGVEALAEELSENAENSARVYEEAYDAARERGEGAIEAGGDAYNAVLEIPEEEEEEAR